jgi:hypothetical protein
MAIAEVVALLAFFGLIVAAFLIVGVAGVLVVALVVAALKLALFLVLLPFRIVGLGLKLGFTAVGLLFRAVFLVAACAVLILLGLIPLVPLLLIGAALYYIVKALRPRPTPPVNV